MDCVRPLIAVMQKNEGQMIYAWALFHAHLFGADCLAIFDNGSDCPQTLRILDELRARGVNVITEFCEPYHFESKGQVLGGYFKYRRHEFDFFIPLDADEFIAVGVPGGVSIDYGVVHSALARLLARDEPLAIRGSYYNVPYSINEYFFHKEDKVFFAAHAFESVDMGFHFGKTKESMPRSETDIVHLHLCHKPLRRIQRDAANKLAMRLAPGQEVETYSGPGQHLVKYFSMASEEYRQSFGGGVNIDSFASLTASLGVDFRFFLQDDESIGGNRFPSRIATVCGAQRRDHLVRLATRIAQPPLQAFADGRLPDALPPYCFAGKQAYARDVAALECVGRLFCGIAPWLQLGEKESAPILEMLIEGLERDAASDDPQLKWGGWRQNLVDASYFAIGLLSAPALLERLSERGKSFVKSGLERASAFEPFDNNWVLMPAVIHLCLDKYWGCGNRRLIISALSKVEGWYVGDGFYKDGPYFAQDYYNSFVFHPFLMEIAKASGVIGEIDGRKISAEGVLTRARKYAQHLERLADADGLLPMIGRSICYRSGNLFLLSKLALDGALPDSLSMGGVRELLFASANMTLGDPASYTDDGFLAPGYAGRQIRLAEDYITSGSLYMASLVFNVLGLDCDDKFWTARGEMWTARKARTRLAELLDNEVSLERGNGHCPTPILTKV